MKFLWSTAANAGATQKLALGDKTCVINNGRSLQFLDSQGHSMHYQLPDMTKGRIVAMCVHKQYIVAAELGSVACIHLLRTTTVTSTGKVSKLETVQTFPLTNPNIQIMDVSLSTKMHIAVLLSDRIIMFQAQTPQGFAFESNLPASTRNPTNIKFDEHDPAKIWAWSSGHLSVLRMELMSKEWTIVDEYVHFHIDKYRGELTSYRGESMLKGLPLLQDFFESESSGLLVERAIAELDETVDGELALLDEIMQVICYGLDQVLVLTKGSKVFHVNVMTQVVTNILGRSRIKQGKIYIEYSDYMANHENFPYSESQILSMSTHAGALTLHYASPTFAITLAPLQFSENHGPRTSISFQLDERAAEKDNLELDSEIVNSFHFNENGSVRFACELILAEAPRSIGATTTAWVTLNQNVSWLAALSNSDTSIAFYNADTGIFLFEYPFKRRIVALESFSSLILLGFQDGSASLYTIEGLNRLTHCVSYKLFDGAVDLAAASHSKFVFGSSSSEKAFVFNLDTQKLDAVVKTTPVKGNIPVHFAYFYVHGSDIFYSAYPIKYVPGYACLLGKIGRKQTQVICSKAFKPRFVISGDKIKARGNGLVLTFSIAQVADASMANLRIDPIAPVRSTLPFAQFLGDDVLEPDNKFLWIFPREAEFRSFRISECWSHVAMAAGGTLSIYCSPGSQTYCGPVHFTPSNVCQIDELLESYMAATEKSVLELKFKEERSIIQSRLNLLIGEIKSMKEENSGLPDMQKIDPNELVLNRAVITQRETAQMLAAEKLQSELKNRIALALAKEELIEKYCNDSIAQRDGAIRGFKKSMKIYGRFYEDRKDAELSRILDQTEEIIKRWQNTLTEEYRVQASARTDQQNAELDEYEAEGGESTDDIMQRLSTRGIGIGAANEHFLPQLWLLDGKSRSDQEKLMMLAAAAIRGNFNAKAMRLFDRKVAECGQHRERTFRRQEILDELKELPDALKLIPGFKDDYSWELSLDEEPSKLTRVSPEEVDKVLNDLYPDVFDLEQRRLQRENKGGVAEDEDSEAKKQRKRALVDMMNGVLEVRDDIFATNVPYPKFMDRDSDEYIEESEWDDEMKKSAKSYDKKVKLLEETRVKYKQQLLSEAKKLVDQDSASANSFDSALRDLCAAKGNSDAEQHSILLRAARLKMVSEHYGMVSEQNLGVDAALKGFEDWDDGDMKALLEQSLNQFKTKLDAIASDERANEKMFRKEILPDLMTQAGQDQDLHDAVSKGYKNTKLAAPVDLINYVDDVTDRTPIEIANEFIDRFINVPVQMPLDEENPLFERLHENFVQKYELEVRRKVIETIQAYCLRQRERLERGRATNEHRRETIEQDNTTVTKNMSENLLQNLPVQLLLKQGIVQLDGVDMSSGQEYSQCTLVERHEIEALNEQILTIGVKKLDEMKRQIQFKQQIRLYQWELRKLDMTQEDCHQKTREIQLFKLSKNVQQLIEGTGGNSGGQKTIASQIGMLEKSLAVQKKMMATQERNFQRRFARLRVDTKTKSAENTEYNQVIQSLAHSVAEKRLLDEVARDRAGQQARRKMHTIVKRRQLVEMARAQAQHLAVLHGELERMRMRTFPALTSLQEK